MVERRHRRGEDGRRQRKVDRDRPLAGYARRDTGRIGEVEPLITRHLREGCCRAAVDAGGLALQTGRRPVSELLVIPVLTAGGHELEPFGYVSAGTKGSEARKQVAASQVACATEYDESLDHVRARPCRARGSPRVALPWTA
jgi:hypothetical protein